MTRLPISKHTVRTKPPKPKYTKVKDRVFIGWEDKEYTFSDVRNPESQWFVPIGTRRLYAPKDPLMWIMEYMPEIRVPGKGYIPYQPTYVQQKVLKDKSYYRHINKSRQIGFTTTFAIEALHDFIYTPTAEIIVLSKSEKEAKKFIEKFYVAYESIKDKDPNAGELKIQNAFNCESFSGSTLNVITSSKGAGRSFSATRVYFDEMAHTVFADDIYQAMMPTVSVTGGKVTLFSSPKGRAGLFAEIGRNTEDQGFSGHRFEWFMHPAYNPFYEQTLEAHLACDWKTKDRYVEEARKGDWYLNMRKKFTELAFKQEYEADYDADIDTVFSQWQLRDTFRKPETVMHLEEVIDPLANECWRKAPIAGHAYVTGIDLGRKRDATVLVTFDTSFERAELVEYKRLPPDTADWGLIEKAIRDTFKIYDSEMVHDATGVGDSISERIIDISEPQVLTKSYKYNMIENMRRCMDLKMLELPRIPRFYREFEEMKWDDKHLVQDIVIACGLAVNVFYQPEQVWTGAEEFNYVES